MSNYRILANADNTRFQVQMEYEKFLSALLSLIFKERFNPIYYWETIDFECSLEAAKTTIERLKRNDRDAIKSNWKVLDVD